MYRESLALTFRMSKFVFSMIAIIIVYYALVEKKIWGFTGGSGGEFFGYVIIAFYAHYFYIFSTLTPPKSDARRLFGFFGWNIFLLIFSLIPFAAITLIYFFSAGDWIDLNEESHLVIFFMAFVASYGVCSLFVYSFLGTVLPAQVAGREKGLAVALRRGRENFFITFWRLLIGPGFVLTVSSLLYATLITTAIIPETFFADGWTPNIAAILAEIIFLWCQFWATIMVAWILSTAFLNSELSEEAGPQKMVAD